MKLIDFLTEFPDPADVEVSEELGNMEVVVETPMGLTTTDLLTVRKVKSDYTNNKIIIQTN